jgi:hypothetical protein
MAALGRERLCDRNQQKSHVGGMRAYVSLASTAIIAERAALCLSCKYLICDTAILAFLQPADKYFFNFDAKNPLVYLGFCCYIFVARAGFLYE